MCSGGSTTIMLWWVSPFGHPRIKAWEATPRGLSQPPTSFIGSRRQGIHRWLFVAWKNKDARARYGILKGPRTNAARRRRSRRCWAVVAQTATCRPLGPGRSRARWSWWERCSRKTEQRRDRLDASSCPRTSPEGNVACKSSFPRGAE
jgi:hypothetical protein